MKMRSVSMKFIFTLIFILTFNLLTCDNQEISAWGKFDFHPDSAVPQPGHLPGEDHSSWDIGSDSLLKLIELKKEELQALERKIAQKSIELAEKEQEFAKIEADLRAIHDNSTLLLFIGLGLFIAGYIFFLATRKSAKKTRDAKP